MKNDEKTRNTNEFRPAGRMSAVEKAVSAISPEPPTQSDAAEFVVQVKRSYEKEYSILSPQVSVTFTGHKSEGVLGYYAVKSRSIFVNEAGMTNYCLHSTLIHELAHHFQHASILREGATTTDEPGRSHGQVFHAHHARLRALAIREGLIQSLDQLDSILSSTAQFLKGLRRRSGAAILEMGRELARAREQCRLIGENFEVFLQESIDLDRTTAYDYVRAYEMGMPPDLTYTVMRFIMRLQEARLRKEAIEDALAGIPLAILRLRYAQPKQPQDAQIDEVTSLLRERAKILNRLVEIDTELQRLGYHPANGNGVKGGAIVYVGDSYITPSRKSKSKSEVPTDSVMARAPDQQHTDTPHSALEGAIP